MNTPGDAIVPIGELLLAPGAVVLSTWEGSQGAAADPTLQSRLVTWLDVLQALYGPRAQPLCDALLGGDGRAWAALAQIAQTFAQALQVLMPRVRAAKQQRDWAGLAPQAALAVQLADALGREADLALAAHLLANARVGLGDLSGAVVSFRRSIGAAAAAGDVRLQSIGHGNLANTLRDAGDCDAALGEYDAALAIETDARGRAVLQSNRAVALQRLGERDSAVRAQLAQVQALEAAAAPVNERVVALARSPCID